MISGHAASVFFMVLSQGAFSGSWAAPPPRQSPQRSPPLHRPAKCQRTRRRRRTGCDNVIDQQHPPAGQVCAGAAAKRAPGVLQALLAGKFLLRAAPALDVQRCLHRDPQHARPTGAPAAAADPAYRAAAGGGGTGTMQLYSGSAVTPAYCGIFPGCLAGSAPNTSTATRSASSRAYQKQPPRLQRKTAVRTISS